MFGRHCIHFHPQTAWIVSVICLGIMVLIVNKSMPFGNYKKGSFFHGYQNWTSPWSERDELVVWDSSHAHTQASRAVPRKSRDGKGVVLEDVARLGEEECIPQSKLSRPFGLNHTEKYLNILDHEPPEHLPNYKNPCWRECNDASMNPYESNFFYIRRNSYKLRKTDFSGYFDEALKLYKHQLDKGATWRLRCLPYFYLIGFSKCGTTDLFYNLMRHPMMDTFLLPSHSYYWNWWKNTKGGPYVPIRDLVDLFDQGASHVQNITSRSHDFTNYHPVILGEGTPMTIWDMDKWSRLPENDKCLDGPCYWSAHYIHHITPQARFIVMMRNPIDRSYSDYLYLRQWVDPKPGSAQDFHERVEAGIKLLDECKKAHGIQSCLYSDTLEQQMGNKGVRLLISLYAIHIKQWLKVFPKDQFHFVLYEDYVKDKLSVLNSIVKFLGLGPMPLKISNQIRRYNSVKNKNEYRSHAGEILPKTRTLLDSYFLPHNKMLADLLQDNRFLWNDDVNASEDDHE